MTKTAKHLVRAILSLPDLDRARAITALKIAEAKDAPFLLSPEWLEELKRREDELDRGLVKAIPWEEVEAQIDREIFGEGKD